MRQIGECARMAIARRRGLGLMMMPKQEKKAESVSGDNPRGRPGERAGGRPGVANDQPTKWPPRLAMACSPGTIRLATKSITGAKKRPTCAVQLTVRMLPARHNVKQCQHRHISAAFSVLGMCRLLVCLLLSLFRCRRSYASFHCIVLSFHSFAITH